MKYIFTLSVLIVLNTISGYGQVYEQQSVSGLIKDVNNAPLPYVTVGIKGTEIGSITDERGYYHLSLPTGTFVLTTASLEYESENITIKLGNKEHKQQNIQLKSRNNTNLDEVVVYGKTAVQQVKEGAFTVNAIDLSKYANTTTDINQVLKRSPGVTIRENGGFGSDFTFKINGLDAKIFIDGVPMENFGSSMSLNNIPVNLVERIEVFKGVVPAYLAADVLGGAVNIITKRKHHKFIDVSYGYGSFNTHQASTIVNATDHKTGLAVKASAFFNHSDNDYTMYSNSKYDISLKEAVKSIDENGNPQWKMVETNKAKRFYDGYTSGMGKLEVGFENRKWADRLLVGLSYSQNKNELQLGSTVNSVYGGRWSENDYLMPSLQYKKDSLFFPNLFAEVYTSYGKSITNIKDTAQHQYDWSGKPILFSAIKDPSHHKYENRNYILRTDFTYRINNLQTNTLSLNYSFTTNQQKSYDMMEQDEHYRNTSGLPKQLGKHLINLSWQKQWLNNRLSTVLSAKYYGMSIRNDMDERKVETDGSVNGDIVTQKDFKGYTSGNFAFRYLLHKDVGIKGSIERAYNLPSITSMFGDGVNYLANTNIKPERSDNFNLGAFYNTFLWTDHYLNIDISGFYRNADNYISSIRLDDKYQYQNVHGAKLYGFEFDMRYGYKDLINFSINGSYDKALENERYTDDTKQEESLVYKQQLPNRPWIYGNADLSIGKNNLLGKGTRIEMSYMYQYVHWFYLSWANLGGAGTKNYVPSQNIHTALASFSWGYNKYSISVEARNFTNELAYDNFRLQKPGRAFYTKFRISIM